MITVTVKRKDFVNGYGALDVRVKQELRKLEAHYGRPVLILVSDIRHNEDNSVIWRTLSPIPDAKPPMQS